MPTTICAQQVAPPTLPTRQLRDISGELVDMIEKAGIIAETIEDKLFGVNQGEACDQACPPNNVQTSIERALRAISKLHSRLDSINSRL